MAFANFEYQPHAHALVAFALILTLLHTSSLRVCNRLTTNRSHAVHCSHATQSTWKCPWTNCWKHASARHGGNLQCHVPRMPMGHSTAKVGATVPIPALVMHQLMSTTTTTTTATTTTTTTTTTTKTTTTTQRPMAKATSIALVLRSGCR